MPKYALDERISAFYSRFCRSMRQMTRLSIGLFAKPIQILSPHPPQLSYPEGGQFLRVDHFVKRVSPDKEEIHNFFRRKELIFSFFYFFIIEIIFFHIDLHFLILPPAALTQSVIGASANSALCLSFGMGRERFRSLGGCPGDCPRIGRLGPVSFMGLFCAISSP